MGRRASESSAIAWRPSEKLAYDTFGNLTTDAQTGLGTTTSTYDLAGKLTGIDTGGSATKTAFTFDALGRFATRTVGLSGSPTSTDTYSYAGGSETVARIHTVAGTTTDTDSIVDAGGNRLGVKQGSAVNWFLPDLHGNIAASLQSDEAKLTNAIRYDPYGQTIATGAQAGASSPVGAANWRYQGRLDVSPVAGSPLYDMSARFYSPGIGAFTQLDSVMGSAQNPLSMNRFLYAEANPATMTDPTGHGVDCGLGETCTTAERAADTKRQQANHKAKYRPKPHAGAKRPQKRATQSSNYRIYIDPDELGSNEEWRALLDSSYNDIISGRYVAGDGTRTEEGWAAYARYEGLLKFQRDNEVGFCAATGNLCHARSEARPLGLIGFGELLLTGAMIVDPIPGDEAAAAVVDGATAIRIAKVEEELTAAAARLQGRATELHELLDSQIAQRQRVTTVIETYADEKVVASGVSPDPPVHLA